VDILYFYTGFSVQLAPNVIRRRTV